MVGFFMEPTLLPACGLKSKKSCCKSGNTSQAEKDCCKKHKSTKDQKENDCGGKCDHSSCNCPGYTGLSFIEEKSNNIESLFSETLNYSSIEAPLSPGFFFVWLPPKIG
jgi:hypothetical protein